ncbi:MAG TPA: serine/threonine protein kinase [Cyanobacteria bacterium UBA11369]|nr:serine/threonine protein kinase [Cyanobacteria bacterium UBA11371]HBE34328.1 serine/threonine protein kinase [Cyanobacteria bacterium UBA11368]HBE47347.1 serine/threonine protein kinase [Cyanobacteria bacterium UBA11369]
MTVKLLGERYAIQRQLGQQTGRKTFLAQQLQTQELVVVKILSLGNDFEWQDLKLFEREAETLKALSHPAIPRYLDYLELDSPDNKGFALVQTYVEGKTLEEHLKAGRTFSEAEVKELAKSLLEILTYLHEHQPPVIHRDIKPSNILLTNRSGNSVGQVYLVDFGSVQTLAAKEGGTITVVGTYGYMPPEQFGGRAVPASDLYSLGATLIYLITGKHPTELPQKDFCIQFQPVANIDPVLADWLQWMTEPSLDKRFDSASKALQVLSKPRMRKKANLSVRKPRNSEVELTKTDEFIDILIPPRGLTFGAIAFLSALIPLSFWGLFFLMSLRFRYPIPEALILLFVIAPVSVSVIKFILFIFRQFCLRIDYDKIYFINEMFGFKWNRFRPASKRNISKLEIINGFGSDEVGNVGWRPTQLIIWAGKQKYELDWKVRLNDSEIKWLASELSDWLELPIEFRKDF